MTADQLLAERKRRFGHDEVHFEASCPCCGRMVTWYSALNGGAGTSKTGIYSHP